jgi:hypothetical protein
MIFSANPIYDLNYRFETGVSLIGNDGKAIIFTAYEHFADDLSMPYPQPSNVYQVGLRLNGRIFN